MIIHNGLDSMFCVGHLSIWVVARYNLFVLNRWCNANENHVKILVMAYCCWWQCCVEGYIHDLKKVLLQCKKDIFEIRGEVAYSTLVVEKWKTQFIS